jgi:hypothetical protein
MKPMSLPAIKAIRRWCSKRADQDAAVDAKAKRVEAHESRKDRPSLGRCSVAVKW